jgi:hypothetical protein
MLSTDHTGTMELQEAYLQDLTLTRIGDKFQSISDQLQVMIDGQKQPTDNQLNKQ